MNTPLLPTRSVVTASSRETMDTLERKEAETVRVSIRALRPRKTLPSERADHPQRQTDELVDPVSTLRILEHFENKAPIYELSRSAWGWQLLQQHLRSSHDHMTTPQQWNHLPTHVGETALHPRLPIGFLNRENIDVYVCDFSPNKAQASTENMRDFERLCRHKPDDVSLRWIHVPIGLGMFQSTLEDIFLHCDPEGMKRPDTFVRSGLPRWPYPEVNMMTFINREDHQARIKAVQKLSSMPEFENLPPDTGLCDTVKNDLRWRSKILDKKPDFWEMVNGDFPTPISEKICLRQDIGPLLGRTSSTDFPVQALSKHEQFAKASLVLSKLRVFNRADGFVLTFANTCGIDYLTRDFKTLIKSPGYDMLYHRDASVIAHTMHAFKHSGTKRWKRACDENDAVWLIVYLITEAAVTPHNIRGGRSATDILDAYMEVMQSLKKKKDVPWALGQSPVLVREYQQYMEELKTIESITRDNLRMLENIKLDVLDVENRKCNHAQCALNDRSDRDDSDGDENPRHKPESMTQRLDWAMAILKEREADLRRMEQHFQKALKNLLDICIIEQNDRSVVADTMNKAILLFTGITVIFLPLSFITSYLGMNLSDIRETAIDQVWFWKYLGSAGLVISVVSILYSSRLHFRSMSLAAQEKMKKT
ncbi:hypothetical protein F4861DRAFT_543366 [Xylaria intraflava]|nr:hypothetical protein F4861DRAFT_543366 [Xylaria intraflava]